MNNSVSIFGCGWLGSALASELIQAYDVRVSVRSKDAFEKLAFEHKYILIESNHYHSEMFFESDVLVIAIPPRDGYLETLEMIGSYIDPKTQLILYSSTSVYDQNPSGTSLMIQGEELLSKQFPHVTILRLGGLMGYDRIAGRYTAGKMLPQNTYANYIHRDDAVAITKRCIEERITSAIFDVVAPLHPPKKEIFDQNAKRFGFEKTHFASIEPSGKILSPSKLIKLLDYAFMHEDPLRFWDE